MTDAMRRQVEQAARVLDAGGVVVMPTDTVYGLAARPDRPEAVKRLYELKGRDGNKPIALLVSDASMLSGKARELADRYWPGALTIVSGGEGYRMPDDETALALIALCGGKLRVTSANLSGAGDSDEAPAGLGADYVLDAGKSKLGRASTVVKVEGDKITVLREGAIKP
ncbi:MAG: L-threonylcarbamoyladenylate synthase [Kiritimatiellae bacterium]|nr:L-threonylcarbamoyladenylate synthase [Kiritimatiellia bacterium]